jgi:hypothetical protein
VPGFLTSHSHLPFHPRSAGFLHSSQSGERPGQAAVHYPQKQNPADFWVFRFSAPDSADRGGPRPSERAF